jgi:hypothetical protein
MAITQTRDFNLKAVLHTSLFTYVWQLTRRLAISNTLKGLSMTHKIVMLKNIISQFISLASTRMVYSVSLVVCVALLVTSAQALSATTATATTTSLSLISGGNIATSVASGSMVTLTAAVNAGTNSVTVGQVKFCDATATYCTDIHLIGTAQMTSAGTAVLRIIPGIGNHSYKAVFVGTTSSIETYASSTSSDAALTVTKSGTAKVPTVTAINAYGKAGDYSLQATVTGYENIAHFPTPTGTVSFLNTSQGDATLSSAILTSAGIGMTNFVNSQSLAVEYQPTSIAIGDFNRDGIPDIAVVNECGASSACTSGTISVYLGKGDGTFAQAANSPISMGQFTFSVVVADFDGDGYSDLAVSNGEVITILHGNGDGTFMQESNISDIGGGYLSVGDFNGDGIPDLAIFGGNGFTVFLGKGHGSFTQAAGNADSADGQIDSMAVGDINGDGIADIVTANYGGTLSIFLGNGDGTFKKETPVNLGSVLAPWSVAIGDFNSDGKADLAVASQVQMSTESYGTLTVLLGDGTGNFSEAPNSPMGVGVNPRAVAVGDFNADGIADLVVSNDYYGTVQIFLGNNDGTFSQPSISPITIGGNADAIAIADFNGDGISDFATVQDSKSIVSVELSQLTESATATVNNVIPASTGTHLIDASYPGDSIYLASSSTTTPLTTPPAQVATTTSLQITSGGSTATSVSAGSIIKLTATVRTASGVVSAGQVNFCDASATLCAGIHLLGTAQLTSTGTAVLSFSAGVGTHQYKAVFLGLSSASTNDTASASNEMPLTVTASASIATTTTISSSGSAGDYLLTATVTTANTTLSAFPSGSVSFIDTTSGNSILASSALGDGLSTLNFTNAQIMTVGYSPYGIATADFNGDGIPDIATANSDSNNVTIALGNGNGTFTPTSSSPATGTEPVSLVAGDFNGDGLPDLAVANASSNTISVLLGNGKGGFTAVSKSPTTGSEPATIISADFNGDGIPDLATANLTGNTITILLGNGDGTFTQATNSPIAVGNGPVRVAEGDFNGDGIPDLAIANSADNTVSILLGNGNGTFKQAPGSPFFVGTDPTSVAVGDFNGDGKPDLAVVNFSDETVSILIGNGDGTFTPAPGSPVSAGFSSYTLALADFNGDGIVDLAVTNIDSYQVQILLGNGDGTFAAAANSPIVDVNCPRSIAIGDFTGNGIPNIAIANYANDTATILVPTRTVQETASASGVSLIGAGTHNMKASYPGDSNYGSSTSSTIPLIALPAVTATLSSSSINSLDSLTVKVSVNGGTGNATPTGTITLSSGSYSSAATSLSGGSANISIAAGILPVGTDTITASYSGDSSYGAATTTASVTILLSSFTVSGTSISLAPGSTTGNTSTITVTPTNSFTGTIELTASITTSPTGAVNLPTVSFGTSSTVIISGSSASTTTLTIGTLAATSSASPYTTRHSTPWIAGGGTAVACILLIGVPTQRRNWRKMLALLLLFIPIAGAMTACSGSATGTGSQGMPGTTAGAYIITVSGTSGTLTQTSTINLTVQ